MKRLLIIGSFFTAALIFWGCGSSLKVTSDYDKSANFQQYKTFSLERVSDTVKQTISQLHRDRIYNAVKAQMVGKNFQESSSNPDLIVLALGVLRDKQSVSSTTNYYGYGGYYRPYGWGGGMGGSGYTTYNVDNYKEGSIIIDVVDAKTQKLVWEGVGNKDIDSPSKDPDKAISDAIATIMAKFPPGAASK